MDQQELERYRAIQRLAYEATVDVANRLPVGISERKAAAMLRAELHTRGVTAFFHPPFAWFGDRTAFTGFRSPFDFFPTDRRLEPGMPAILDVAPTVDGRSADIGYAFAAGTNETVERALDDLLVCRELILRLVRQENTLKAVYAAVDTCLQDMGYQNRHQQYPFRVLAHRVDLTTHLPLIGQAHVGLSLEAGLSLLVHHGWERLQRAPQSSALWNDAAYADVRPTPGLWAFEPHVGKDGVGAKWEEILVITESTAYWLDDDLPHVRRHEWTTARSIPNTGAPPDA